MLCNAMKIPRNLKRASALILTLTASYAVVGSLLIPYLAKTRLERLLASQVHGKVTIGQISLNPFTLSLRVTDTSLRNDSGHKLASLGELSTAAELWPLRQNRLVLNDTTVSNLTMFDPELGDEILMVQAVKLAGISYDWAKNSLILKDLRFAPGKVKLTITDTGTLRLAEVVEQQLALDTDPANSAQEKTSGGEDSENFDLSVNRIELEDYSFVLASNLRQTPGQWSLEKINISIKQFQLAEGSRIPLEITFAGKSGGKVKMLGDVVMQPLQIRGKIDINELPLKEVSSITEVHGLTLAAGFLSSALDLDLSFTEHPSVRIDGNILISEPRLLYSELTEPLFAAQSVALETLHLTGFPLSTKANSLAFMAPALHYQISGVSESKSDAPTGTAEQSKAYRAERDSKNEIPNMEIAKITVNNGEVSILDKSRSTPRTHYVKDLGLTLNNLSLSGSTAANFLLVGRLYGEAPMSIKGTAVPAQFPTGIDVSLKLDKAPLQTISVYAAPYLGREIATGKVSATMKASFHGDNVRGENHFTLHRLALGQEVPSAEAINAPLETIISIMRDRNGDIALDIPVVGKTNQPSFLYTKLLGDALRNTLLEFAASPFTLLSAIYDWKGAEVGNIGFSVGESTLAASELEKLNLLTKALLEKEGLEITITPSSSPKEIAPSQDNDPTQQSPASLSAESLAITRGQLIKDTLIANGVPATRIYLSAPRTVRDVNNGVVVTELSLH